jgi:hypothetical protein
LVTRKVSGEQTGGVYSMFEIEVYTGSFEHIRPAGSEAPETVSEEDAQHTIREGKEFLAAPREYLERQ